MSIKSIRIENLLSYDCLIVNKIADLNCVLGKNNVGKSNLLKLLSYFYKKINGEKCLPPDLHSGYSSLGSIAIEYDMSRIKSIVTSNREGKSDFFKHIYNTFFKGSPVGAAKGFFIDSDSDTSFTLKLIINKDDSVSWSTKNEDHIKIIGYLFPFFEIETRHINLYDWDKIWELISRLKSFKVNSIDKEEIIELINEKISPTSNAYKDFISKVENITKVSSYSYREKVLNYVKVGLNGQRFNVKGNDLTTQSDGTNSSEYLSIFFKLLIALTRREYISPIVFVDEPETGLHPKASEKLIYEIYQACNSFKKKADVFEVGKYATPLPKIFIATHSANIVKFVVKYFKDNHQLLHFKKTNSKTKVSTLKSTYSDKRFLNVFNDNEARLYFSDLILFVEGDTELEAFSNFSLAGKFPHMNLIELYQASSNVYLENLNPNRSKLSVPYFYLFDRDKTIQFELGSRQCKIILQANGQLYSLKNAGLKKEAIFYKKGYSQEFMEQVNLIKSLQSAEGVKIDFNNKTLDFDNRNRAFVEDIFYKIDQHLLRKNIIVLNSTFEKCLINEGSIRIFLKWLGEVSGFDDKLIVDSLKEREALDIKVLATYMRMIFNGKAEVGLAYNRVEKPSKDFIIARKILKIIEGKTLEKSYFTGKTGGWVTSFLDFAVDYIDDASQEKGISFEDEFSSVFSEFYSMITMLRLDRGKGIIH
jgi:predicted ATP-dependent endonuclease of OLD family